MKKKVIRYEDEKNGKFSLEFRHEDLADIPSYLRDEFQEAIDRFGSLLAENIEHMEKYKIAGHADLSGIITTLKKLKEANEEEDRLSDISYGEQG